jgi:hypothetical protein
MWRYHPLLLFKIMDVYPCFEEYRFHHEHRTMTVGSAKESGSTMIQRAVTDSVVIHENLVSTGQALDAHVA